MPGTTCCPASSPASPKKKAHVKMQHKDTDFSTHHCHCVPKTVPQTVPIIRQQAKGPSPETDYFRMCLNSPHMFSWEVLSSGDGFGCIVLTFPSSLLALELTFSTSWLGDDTERSLQRSEVPLLMKRVSSYISPALFKTWAHVCLINTLLIKLLLVLEAHQWLHWKMSSLQYVSKSSETRHTVDQTFQNKGGSE